MLMHSYGLLNASFHPDASARGIRELARHRDNMLRSAGKLLSSKVPKQKSRVGQVFRLCANSMKNVKTGLGV